MLIESVKTVNTSNIKLKHMFKTVNTSISFSIDIVLHKVCRYSDILSIRIEHVYTYIYIHILFYI